MADLKRTIYSWAVGRPVALAGAPRLGWRELVAYLWWKGGGAYLRGLVRRRRLGTVEGRFFIGPRVTLLFPRHIHAGRGVFIGGDSYVNGLSTSGVRLGHGVRIREGGWIQATATIDAPGVGLTIGDDTYIGPRVLIGAGGGVQIGARVSFGAGVQLLAENHAFNDPDRPIQAQGVTRQGIVVEDDVWIGNAAIILDGVTVGRGAVIGAGSVVAKDVPAGAVVVGNPARVVSHRGGAS